MRNTTTDSWARWQQQIRKHLDEHGLLPTARGVKSWIFMYPVALRTWRASPAITRSFGQVDSARQARWFGCVGQILGGALLCAVAVRGPLAPMDCRAPDGTVRRPCLVVARSRRVIALHATT